MLHINRELNGSKIDRVQIERSVASKEIAEEKRSTIGFIYEYYLPNKRIGIFSSRFRREELSIFSSTLERCTFDRFVFSFLSLFMLAKSGSQSLCGQGEIRNCAQWFGTGPPSPCKRFHATTFFRVSSFVCARLLRAPAHRKYAARGTNGWCRRADGCPMLVRNATFMLSILWTLADSTRSLLPRFFILHPFQTDYRLRGSTLDISLFRLTHFLPVIYYGRDENKIFHDIFFFFPLTTPRSDITKKAWRKIEEKC